MLNAIEVQVVHNPFDGLSAASVLFKAPEGIFRESILQDVSLKQGECGPEDRCIADRQRESSFTADPTFEIAVAGLAAVSICGFSPACSHFLQAYVTGRQEELADRVLSGPFRAAASCAHDLLSPSGS